MELMSMVSFVLDKTNKTTNEWSEDDQIRLLDEISNYANFLNQPLKLEMFVPCDEDGNVLEYPFAYNFKFVELFTNYNIKYQRAKEKVLFEGFECNIAEFCDEPMLELESKKTYFLYDCEDKNFQDNFDTFVEKIEDLVKYNLTLRPNAIKKLNL